MQYRKNNERKIIQRFYPAKLFLILICLFNYNYVHERHVDLLYTFTNKYNSLFDL